MILTSTDRDPLKHKAMDIPVASISVLGVSKEEQTTTQSQENNYDVVDPEESRSAPSQDEVLEEQVVDLEMVPTARVEMIPRAASSRVLSFDEQEDDDDDGDQDEEEGFGLMPPSSHPALPYQSNNLNNRRSVPTMSTSGFNEDAEFLATVRFCINIGQAAFRYGSSGAKVEVFLQRLVEDRFRY